MSPFKQIPFLNNFFFIIILVVFLLNIDMIFNSFCCEQDNNLTVIVPEEEVINETGNESLNEFRNYITTDYPMFFQQAGSCQMEGIIALYNYVMIYLVVILFTVTAAWAYIIYSHIDGKRHLHYLSTVSLSEFILWMRFVQ